MTAIVTKNPLADGADWPPPPDSLAQFHHRMPAYAPTLLLDAPALAERFGVGRVVINAETRRMGLPSFKILGASWATYQAISAHIGHEPEPWVNINELAVNLAHLRPFKLATATDGNHGRAVSFMARLLGFECHIFVPAGMVRARIEPMEREGATVTVVDGDYVDDDAARRAMRDLAANAVAAGETGAACLAGFDALMTDDDALAALPDLSTSTILLLVTEGATDPDNFEAVVGRSPESVGRVLTAIA